ncbi:hypothetical protein MKW98_023366 [Papaver atlanticum]|uniref:Uncharacterized protein n=1 Tax=Papaver atlanticum TaxID=357466 RepID=A0AAD4SZU7_9MAGN|nr:hypothetical protein MKW98_023366 [Papaver atlanticum]
MRKWPLTESYAPQLDARYITGKQNHEVVLSVAPGGKKATSVSWWVAECVSSLLRISVNILYYSHFCLFQPRAGSNCRLLHFVRNYQVNEWSSGLYGSRR